MQLNSLRVETLHSAVLMDLSRDRAEAAMYLRSTLDIEFSYLHLQQIMRLLKANGAKIISIDQNNMDRNLLQFEIEHHLATTLINQLKEHLIQPI